MSMLDSFFNKGFKASKCKTLLKLTTPRIKLLRNRREVQIKQMRREIAKLLETGQEATARIRVEHIVREEKTMAAQEILELFCELIAVRLPIIEAQKECPLDLKEAISSVCFAAPRCPDLPELQQVQMLFVSKYGKEFVAAAAELRPDCGVNRKLVELLSVRAPSPETKLKLLMDIAEDHELDWDAAATESEYFKSHEDLLDGPKQFGSGSKLPLPKEKHDEALYSEPASASNERADSDSDFDSLDFPEVPNVSLRPTPGAAPSVASAVSPNTENEHESAKHAAPSEPLSGDMPYKSYNVLEEISASKRDEIPDKANAVEEDKPVKSSPCVSPQSHASESVSVKHSYSSSAQEATQSSPAISPQSAFSESFSARDNYSPPGVQRTKADDVDLRDVLAAAQAAAETAERAATAARSAASLAQIRITELIEKKSNDQPPESPSETPFLLNEKPHFDHQNYSGSYNDLPEYSSPYRADHWRSESTSFHGLNLGSDSPVPKEQLNHHQPQRLPSMDDDPYSSYPNLFTSQLPNFSIGSHSFSENSKPAGDS